MATPTDRLLDQMLVLKCQTGDRAALEELFLRHGAAVRYFLRRMLDDHDAADAAQAVWLRVLRKIATLRSPEAFVVWLYRIARREAMDRLKSRRRPEQPLDNEPPARDDESEFSPKDAARIHRMLGHLAEAHREALVLRFVEELSYEEIAAVVGCGVGTVRSRLHYAKLALKSELEKDHD